jgi:hypothetical protein
VNTTNDLPAPAGAVHLGAWHDAADGRVRRFQGTSRTVERPGPNLDITVTIIGSQHQDTSIEYMIRIAGMDDPDVLAIGEARQLARALFNACEEVGQLSAAGCHGLTSPTGAASSRRDSKGNRRKPERVNCMTRNGRAG